MNFNQARFNMVEQQVRPWDVLNGQVLDVLATLPREQFVPAMYQALAYTDTAIPLTERSNMLPPREVGRILQALALQPTDQVLEVGTGSGYLAACLAQLAAHVTSVELDADLVATAKAHLQAQNIENVAVHEADGTQGWVQAGPYDAIVITASVPAVPEAILQQLKPGGRLFCVLGQAPAMQAQLQVKDELSGQMQIKPLFETVWPRLANVPEPSAFSF